MICAQEAVESKLHFFEDGVQYITQFIFYIVSNLFRKIVEVLKTTTTKKYYAKLFVVYLDFKQSLKPLRSVNISRYLDEI